MTWNCLSKLVVYEMVQPQRMFGSVLKINHTPTTWTSHSLPRYSPKRNEDMHLYRHFHTIVHGCSTCKSWKFQTISYCVGPVFHRFLCQSYSKLRMAFCWCCVKAIHTKGVSQGSAEALIMLASKQVRIWGLLGLCACRWCIWLMAGSNSCEFSCSIVESLPHCFHLVFLGLSFLGIYLVFDTRIVLFLVKSFSTS